MKFCSFLVLLFIFSISGREFIAFQTTSSVKKTIQSNDTNSDIPADPAPPNTTTNAEVVWKEGGDFVHFIQDTEPNLIVATITLTKEGEIIFDDEQGRSGNDTSPSKHSVFLNEAKPFSGSPSIQFKKYQEYYFEKADRKSFAYNEFFDQVQGVLDKQPDNCRLILKYTMASRRLVTGKKDLYGFCLKTKEKIIEFENALKIVYANILDNSNIEDIFFAEMGKPFLIGIWDSTEPKKFSQKYTRLLEGSISFFGDVNSFATLRVGFRYSTLRECSVVWNVELPLKQKDPAPEGDGNSPTNPDRRCCIGFDVDWTKSLTSKVVLCSLESETSSCIFKIKSLAHSIQKACYDTIEMANEMAKKNENNKNILDVIANNPENSLKKKDEEELENIRRRNQTNNCSNNTSPQASDFNNSDSMDPDKSLNGSNGNSTNNKSGNPLADLDIDGNSEGASNNSSAKNDSDGNRNDSLGSGQNESLPSEKNEGSSLDKNGTLSSGKNNETSSDKKEGASSEKKDAGSAGGEKNDGLNSEQNEALSSDKNPGSSAGKNEGSSTEKNGAASSEKNIGENSGDKKDSQNGKGTGVNGGASSSDMTSSSGMTSSSDKTSSSDMTKEKSQVAGGGAEGKTSETGESSYKEGSSDSSSSGGENKKPSGSASGSSSESTSSQDISEVTNADMENAATSSSPSNSTNTSNTTFQNSSTWNVSTIEEKKVEIVKEIKSKANVLLGPALEGVTVKLPSSQNPGGKGYVQRIRESLGKELLKISEESECEKQFRAKYMMQNRN